MKVKYILNDVQYYSVIYDNAVRPVVWVCILLTCEKHLYDLIISLKGRFGLWNKNDCKL